VQGVGCRVQGAGCRVQGVGCGVWGGLQHAHRPWALRKKLLPGARVPLLGFGV
jgi:hypothetical protein